VPREAFNVPYVDGLALLGLAVVFLWLRLIGISLRELCDRTVLTLTGYLRRRPDPRTEDALRAAFAELDANLAEILGDRTRRDQPGYCRRQGDCGQGGAGHGGTSQGEREDRAPGKSGRHRKA
jgi:hypothetical protein